jgi:hypothetical protein
MKYKIFSPVLTTTRDMEDGIVPVVDGQLIVAKDGGGIFYDDGSKRTLVSNSEYSNTINSLQINEDGFFYPLFTDEDGDYITPKQLRSACTLFNKDDTSTLILGDNNLRKGQLQIYGADSGSTKIVPLNEGSNTNTLKLPITTGTLTTEEDMAATYLPLTGGGINGSLWVRDNISTSGNVYIGTSNGTTQSTVGVNSSAGEFALHSNPANGMRGIWDSRSSNYLAYFDTNNNLYYSGGTFTSNLYVGDQYKSTESDVGVNSTVGRMYMYSNPDSGWRGIWDDTMNSYIFRVNAGKIVNYAGGIFQGDIEIPYKASTRGSEAPTVPVSMAVTISSISDLSTYKTLLGTANIGGTWNHIISTRHRNGAGDGTTYGMYIRATLSGNSGLVWQVQSGSTWYGEKTILDSSNWGDYASKTYYGTSAPSSSVGKNGDTYIVYS